MTKQEQLRELLAGVQKRQKVSHAQAIRMVGDLIDRSPATVKRWLSTRPNGKPYPLPPGLIALAILRLGGKVSL